MKKLLVIALSLTLVLVFATYAFADNNIKIGYNFSSKCNDGSLTYDINSNADIGYEYVIQTDQLGYGFGVAYQFQRQFKDVLTSYNFYYIPVYALITYDIAKTDSFAPYLTARLGYNLFYPNDAYKSGQGGDATGGIYYAAGVGAKFNQFKAEVLYEVDNSKLGSFTNIDSAIALKLGYSF